MKLNLGAADKVIRIVAGVAIMSLFFVLEGNARWWGLVGVVLFLTGIFGFCPAYAMFGLSTAKK